MGTDAPYGSGDAHDHSGFEAPGGDPQGRGADMTLLGSFVGAAYDQCTSCQDAMLTRLVEDQATTARLVELACVFVHTTFGGLPASLLQAEAPGPASPEFRTLARAGVDGNNAALFAACGQMAVQQRRAAANTAADIIVGALSLGPPPP